MKELIWKITQILQKHDDIWILINNFDPQFLFVIKYIFCKIVNFFSRPENFYR